MFNNQCFNDKSIKEVSDSEKDRQVLRKRRRIVGGGERYSF
jgi:hypothetical protein